MRDLHKADLQLAADVAGSEHGAELAQLETALLPDGCKMPWSVPSADNADTVRSCIRACVRVYVCSVLPCDGCEMASSMGVGS